MLTPTLKCEEISWRRPNAHLEGQVLMLRSGLIGLLDMMSFYGDVFVTLVTLLTRLEKAHSVAVAVAKALGNEAKANRIPATEDMRDLIKGLPNQRQQLEAAGLKMSLLSFDRLVETANDPKLTVRDMDVLSWDLILRLIDELGLCSFWQVPREYQHLLEPQLFGTDVAEAFPSSMDDIKEAGNCLAFGRSTACVFHLMRVVECGLRSLGQTLGNSDLDPRRNPTWDSILKKCDAEQRKPIADRAPEWRSDNTFFSEVHANLLAIKDGWRNPSLHVERSYTPDQANEIFIAVRAFMRKLATKISESEPIS